jgi:hypothetical protein
MKSIVIYIHGFASGPGLKAELMKNAFPNSEIVAPQLTGHVEEDLVIRDWLVEQFPFATDLDKELAHISSIKPEDFMSNYQDAMNDFYADSDEKERNELISFAMKLAKSDRVITPEENKFLNELFEKWGNGND